MPASPLLEPAYGAWYDACPPPRDARPHGQPALAPGHPDQDAAARRRPRGSEPEHLRHVVDHHLVGAAADRDQPRIDESTAGLALLHVAEAAVELDALVGDVAGHTA